MREKESDSNIAECDARVECENGTLKRERRALFVCAWRCGTIVV